MASEEWGDFDRQEIEAQKRHMEEEQAGEIAGPVYFIQVGEVYFTGEWSRTRAVSHPCGGMHYPTEYGPVWTKDRGKAKLYRDWLAVERDAIGAVGIHRADYMDFIMEVGK